MVEPSAIVEPDGIHHQSVAFPMADGIAEPSGVNILRMTAPVRVDNSEGPLVLKQNGHHRTRLHDLERHEACLNSSGRPDRQALRQRVVDFVAEDIPELLRKIDGQKVQIGGETRRLKTAGAELRPVEWTVRDRVLHALADPQIAYLIAMLGVIGILLELFHPGTIVPGVVGAICLVIAGVAFQMLPVNIGALALCIIGVGLLVAEMYMGGHGWFIGAGIVCIVIGSLLLIGHTGRGFWADPDFGLGWRVVIPVGAALGLISATLVWKFTSSAAQPLRAGAPGLLGEVGEVREAIGPATGRVLVHGELWSARAQTEIPEGARVRVVGVRGLSVDVAPLEPQLKEAT